MIGAVVVVVLGVASAAALPPTNSQGFRLLPHEGWALVAVGVMLGLVALAPLQIRNIVRAVTFQRGVLWATPGPITDESVAVSAVQAGGKDRAVDAIRTLRTLRAEAPERLAQAR
ncbi:hypothetical protein [Actinoplanes sp. ATCC 53533]|uniref:hypothetical protein n=1 Tax=Actinoplanes sp. ATCC 53533 TaxID=1288362 RepID=UPI000F787AE7|nr:hypothetical protein [Actinoplanes sp. ATCC 53533]